MSRRRDERGETLLELLITIGVLSIAVVAILTTIATAFRSQAMRRSDVDGQAALRSYATTLQAVGPTLTQLCAKVNDFPSGNGLPGSPKIAAFEQFNPSWTPTGSAAPFVALATDACVPTTGVNANLMRLLVEAKPLGPSGPVQKIYVVVQR